MSSAARTLASLLSGREDIAYAHAGGVTELASPRWPDVEVVYERASRRVGDGSWVVAWHGGPTVGQIRDYVQEAAEWIGTGRPLRGLAFAYRRELSDAQLVLALDRAIAAGEYGDADLDAMTDAAGWARDAAWYRADQLDFRAVGADELAEYEAIVGERFGYSLGWVVPILRARHQAAAVTKTRNGSGAEGAACAKCDRSLPAGAHRLARYCSNACRQSAWRARAVVMKSHNTTCVGCGENLSAPIDPHRAGRPVLYCSRACQQRAYRRRRQARL